ncbi:glycosyltransferase family 4 protein [Halomicrococcus sp. NG-SE-24]|uniref:glycosyltransferase family 4 protein n=1 Tax=Halomicrococcus sp. NG-SE-24 TaxID=3436928 RepID=UPI003D98D349
MANRRILIRSHFPLHEENVKGGAERLMLNLAVALKQKSWDVDFLCPRISEKPSLPEGVTVYEFPYPSPKSPISKVINSLRGAKKFKEVEESQEYDVVLDNITPVPFYPLHFLSGEDTNNAAFIHVIYYGLAREFDGYLKGSVVSLFNHSIALMNKPDIICAGSSTERRINSRLNYDRTSIINPCVDLDKFEYSFNQDSKTILYLGRLGQRKNVQCLLRAWKTVEQQYPEYELKIAGTGPAQEELEILASQLGLENVEFLGFVSEEEKRRLMRESLLFVIPSIIEGYVTTGLEAMAAGTPVVGANAPGIHDYVKHGDNGLLFEKDDVDSLATILGEAIANPESLERISENGLETAEQHSFAAFRDQAHEVIESLCD